MKRRFTFVLLVGLLLNHSESNSQTMLDTIDPGEKDVIWLSARSEFLTSEANSKFSLDLWIKHDSVDITSLTSGFSWENENAVLDSIIFSQDARTAFDFKLGGLRNDNLDSTNLYRQFLFYGARLFTNGLANKGDSILLATYFFTCQSWDQFDEFTVEKKIFSGGSQLVLVGKNPSERASKFRYVPTWRGPLIIHDPNRPCCVNIMGNIDGADGIDIGDQTLLIDHLFGSGVAISCRDAANVDGSEDGSIDMGDLVVLTEYLFAGGELAECK